MAPSERTPPIEIAQLHGRLGATPFKRSRTRWFGKLTPSPEEQRRIYVAIRNIARAYGGHDVFAEVMGVSITSLNGRDAKSYGFAVLLARAANIQVEQILSGKPHEVAACAVCGRKGAQ